eukprot:3099720-Alexandrium_andersonii.AAC.1
MLRLKRPLEVPQIRNPYAVRASRIAYGASRTACLAPCIAYRPEALAPDGAPKSGRSSCAGLNP